MSRREERGSLKGKHSLFVGYCSNTLLHGPGGREVHLDLKKFRQAVLKTNHIQQRQFLFVIKFRDQIDVGRIVRFSARHGTEQAQMNDTSGSFEMTWRLSMTLFCPMFRSFSTRFSRMDIVRGL